MIDRIGGLGKDPASVRQRSGSLSWGLTGPDGFFAWALAAAGEADFSWQIDSFSGRIRLTARHSDTLCENRAGLAFPLHQNIPNKHSTPAAALRRAIDGSKKANRPPATAPLNQYRPAACTFAGVWPSFRRFIL